MSALSQNFGLDLTDELPKEAKDRLGTTSTPWGYIIGNRADGVSTLRYALARFFGTILFLSGLTLGLLPEGGASTGMIAMKLGGMVMFMLFGGVLLWSGRQRPGAECHVDLKNSVLRIGGRDIAGEFKLTDMLRFDEIQSVFLLRNAQTDQPARLYLRLADNIAIEVAHGDRDDMERLRQRVAYDLTRGARAA